MSLNKIKITNGRVYKKFNDGLEAFKEHYLLGNLKHPNIVRLIDGDGKSEIVMEYTGKSLAFGREDYSAKIEKIDQLLLTMVDVLSYLRSERIVHNDIKPANITQLDVTGKFSLIDFGSAILVSDSTKFLSTSYTIPYASPESLTNSVITDPYKIDIWALGVTILELLLGKNILEGDKAIPVFRNMLKYFAVDESTISRLTFPEINTEKYCKKITILPHFYEKYETDLAKIKKLDLLKDLLSNMLVMNPDKRYSLEDIIGHGYFRLISGNKEIKKYTNTLATRLGQLSQVDLQKLQS